MGQPNKLTKQGVRDLNHPIPKARPVAIGAADVVAAESRPVSPAVVVSKDPITFSIEK